DPAHARSTLYATDVAKTLMVPILHLNGEDPEAAVHAAQLALDYRQKFGKDVVVEVICYRRHGHNEGDEPNFTQPLMYDKIEKRPPLHEIYAAKLVKDGIAEDVIENSLATVRTRLDEAFEAGPPGPRDLGFRGRWQKIQRSYSSVQPDTRFDRQRLLKLGKRLAAVPKTFAIHPKIEKLLQKRLETIEKGEGIDWGTAESLAFASLLVQGHPVRLSGQDSRRGTFNQRHSTLVDQKNGQWYVPLAFLEPGQAFMQVYDSMLSEAAVLGFEYGYSLEKPDGLTLWEAQFGDFANGAQVIIDQFIASSGTKWDRFSGLTLCLPHGYEGQGPEHSSARIERYLQLCADHNMQVANPSTPAQLFHLLRRQVLLPYRRPLIIFTPKSLLRHPECTSRLEDLAGGGFHLLLDRDSRLDQVRTLLLCSGKVAYDLLAQIKEEERSDVGILRVEQLYPFKEELLSERLKHYKNLRQVAWVQEEPENMGAWSFLRPRLARLLGKEPPYIGRPASAATAVGSHRRHKQEQEQLIRSALNLDKDS
ncbi:MAG TPA: 2-oxoglutarate dehydrogenase E1 component, partial [Desulfuromonadales bacterium]|nr:2-oxoglutarate dehydrogenase E1 component [Desulfuromonadales bacterium]